MSLKVAAPQTSSSTKKNNRLRIKYSYNLGDNAKVSYIPKYLNYSKQLFAELLNNIQWKHFKYEVYDKIVTSPRLMNIIDLKKKITYKKILLFKHLLKQVEKLTKTNFNYAVLNYYRNGQDYIGYHSDREVKPGQIVVSVSLGSARRFHLKHRFRSNVKYTFMLADGDILILNDAAIKYSYKHSVPKMANVGPRINITFRQ